MMALKVSFRFERRLNEVGKRSMNGRTMLLLSQTDSNIFVICIFNYLFRTIVAIFYRKLKCQLQWQLPGVLIKNNELNLLHKINRSSVIPIEELFYIRIVFSTSWSARNALSSSFRICWRKLLQRPLSLCFHFFVWRDPWVVWVLRFLSLISILQNIQINVPS